MKKPLFAVFALLSAVVFAAQNDTLISFSTPGPDTYADGTVVRDGECYALVWTKAGATFAGFAADGTVIGSDSELVIATCAAKDGCCPPRNFQLRADRVAARGEGTYSVYLLDTRSADTGLPQGKVRNAAGKWVLKAVNGYGRIEGASTAITSDSSGLASAALASSSATVETRAEAPVDAPKPVVKRVEVKDGKVYVTVRNTAAYLQYNLTKGDAPDALNEKNVATPRQGVEDADGEITLEYPAEAGGAFFQVNRN